MKKTNITPIPPIYPISKSTFIYENKKITLSRKMGLKLILDLNSKFPRVHRGRCAHLFFDIILIICYAKVSRKYYIFE